MYKKRLLYPLAGLSVSVAVHGSTVVGENNHLNCSVTGADSFSPTNITYQWFNESHNPPTQVGTQQAFTFNPLQLYHAGNYTCVVTLSGVTGNLSQNAAQNITVESKSHCYVLIHSTYSRINFHSPCVLGCIRWKLYITGGRCHLHNGICSCFVFVFFCCIFEGWSMTGNP